MVIQMSERMLRYGCARPSLKGPGTNDLRLIMRSRMGTKSANAIAKGCVSPLHPKCQGLISMTGKDSHC